MEKIFDGKNPALIVPEKAKQDDQQQDKQENKAYTNESTSNNGIKAGIFTFTQTPIESEQKKSSSNLLFQDSTADSNAKKDNSIENTVCPLTRKWIF